MPRYEIAHLTLKDASVYCMSTQNTAVGLVMEISMTLPVMGIVLVYHPKVELSLRLWERVLVLFCR